MRNVGMPNGRYAVVATLVAVAVLVTVGLASVLAGAWPGAGAAHSSVSAVPNKEPSAAESSPTVPAEQRGRLTLTESLVKQNGTATLSASGYTPGETVVVSLAGPASSAPKELGRATANSQGQIAGWSVDLPDWVTSGSQTIQAVGQQSKHSAETTLTVRAQYPWMTISSYSVTPTQKLGFVAGGFDPGEKVEIRLRDSSGQPLAVFQADAAGNGTWTEITVPFLPDGQNALLLHGQSSQLDLVQTITIKPLDPLLELSPWAGPPGTSFNLNVRGFAPGENVDAYLAGSAKPVATFSADEYGNLWGAGPLDIPMQADDGRLSIVLMGETSKASTTQFFTVVGVKPWAGLDTYSGPPGSAVSFRGGGFAAGEKIDVHLGDGSGPIVATIQSGSDGSFSQAGFATVPADARDKQNVTFTFVGASSRAQSAAAFAVVVPWAGESLTPVGQPAGSN